MLSDFIQLPRNDFQVHHPVDEHVNTPSDQVNVLNLFLCFDKAQIYLAYIGSGETCLFLFTRQ